MRRVGDVRVAPVGDGECFRMSAKWSACRLLNVPVMTQLSDQEWRANKSRKTVAASKSFSALNGGETLLDAKWHSTLVKQEAYRRQIDQVEADANSKKEDIHAAEKAIIIGWCRRITTRFMSRDIIVDFVKFRNLSEAQFKSVLDGRAALMICFVSGKYGRGHTVAAHSRVLFDSFKGFHNLESDNLGELQSFIHSTYDPVGQRVWGYLLQVSNVGA